MESLEKDLQNLLNNPAEVSFPPGRYQSELTDGLRSLMGLFGLEPGTRPPHESFDFFDPELQRIHAEYNKGDAESEARAAKTLLDEWSNFKGLPWGGLLGGPGIGKTELLKTAGWIPLRRANPDPLTPTVGGIYYITAHNFEERIKDFNNDGQISGSRRPEDYVEMLTKIPMLIIDDIGKGNMASEYVRMMFERLFDGRYVRRNHTLFSTNLSTDGFESFVGIRIVDRLLDSSLCRLVDMSNCVSIRPYLNPNPINT